MKLAFCYMFKDNKFYQKYLYYFIFTSIAAFLYNYSDAQMTVQNISVQSLLMYLLGLIIWAIPIGYNYSCIKALNSQKENFILPMTNLKKNFVTGFKFGLAVSLFILAFIFIAIFISFIHKLLILPLILFIILYSLAFNFIFATTESLTSFFQFKKVINLVNDNKSQYWICLLLDAIVNTIACDFASLLFRLSLSILATAVASILSSIIVSYAAFVNAYFAAKAIKNH